MRRRKGFTLIEVIIVSGLMGFLAMLLAATWAGIGSPTATLIRRAQCIQEIDIATTSLARDLGGNLPGNLGGKKQARFSGWDAGDGTRLTVSYNGVDTIRYYVQNNQLIREVVSTGNKFIAANNVAGFVVAKLSQESPELMQIDITFQYQIGVKNLTRKCTLIAKSPPLSTD
jgi:prepilin-type N-terminal cleavage/methylation domain-containing protein